MALSHKGLLASRGSISGKALQFGVCFTASSGFFLLGYDQGVMSGIITEPIFLSRFPAMAPKNKEGAIQSLVIAIYEIGCLIGALAMVAYGDRLGRRRAILLGASIMIVGAIIQTASFNLGQLIAGRIITGIGNGMNTCTIPMYQSEIAPPRIRGFLVLFEGALITGGIVISYWLNYGFWFVKDRGSFQWRFPIGFQILFAVVLITGILLYPESPRWLLKHNHEETATELMAIFESKSRDDDELKADIDEIKKLNALSDGKGLTWREMLSNGREMNLWRFSAACGSQACQQITGINLVTYYATLVFEDSLDFSPELARFMTAWLGVEYFLAACLALFIVDRYGRRNLMMFGAAGMAASMVVIGASLAYATKSDHAPALAATVFIFVYDTFFAIGWLGVTWLYPAEVTPIRIRAQANGFSTATNWIFNYAVVQLSPIMINTIKWKTYFVFFTFNVLFIPIVYFFFPETNGYKLETLDAIFAEAHSKGQNPVFTEKSYRKTWKEGGQRDLEARAEKTAEEHGVGAGSEDGEKKEGGNGAESDEVVQTEQI